MYKLSKIGVVREDGAMIPEAPGNRDWEAYLLWKEEGNEPEPEFTEEEVRKQLAERIAAKRYEKEGAGLTIAGATVYTDRETQSKLTAASMRAQRDPDYVVNWKCVDGSFITMDSTMIMHVADMAGDYVQACYNREGELVSLLNKGEFEEHMIEEGWPENE